MGKQTAQAKEVYSVLWNSIRYEVFVIWNLYISKPERALFYAKPMEVKTKVCAIQYRAYITQNQIVRYFV